MYFFAFPIYLIFHCFDIWIIYFFWILFEHLENNKKYIPQRLCIVWNQIFPNILSLIFLILDLLVSIYNHILTFTQINILWVFVFLQKWFLLLLKEEIHMWYLIHMLIISFLKQLHIPILNFQFLMQKHMFQCNIVYEFVEIF